MKSESPENLSIAAPTWWVVAQVKSNRVVYFTDDPGYTPPVEENWYYVSSYQGALPGGMTLRNCWRWRFNGGVFKDAGKAKPAKDAAGRLLDHNRKALLRILKQKIDAVRVKHAVSCRMGTEVRKEKLGESRDFLAGGAGERYPFLEAVAAARDVSLADAARLIVEREQATRAMLVETEQIRERLKVAIHAAQSAEELQGLREQLLGEVYPKLSERFAVKFIRTTPLDRHRPLSERTLFHERNRLRAQLRTAVNAMRAGAGSGYALDELVRARKLAAARAPETADPLLEGYARENGLTLEEAARRILQDEAEQEKRLVESELLKDALLAEISRARTEHDLHLVSMKLKSASARAPSP